MSEPGRAVAASLKFPPHTSLRAALLSRVDDHFQATGRRRDGGLRIVAKSVVILAWLAASYGLLVFWADAWWEAALLSVSLGLAVAGVGFNVQHDGGHGAYSRRGFGNRFSALALDLIGGSSYFWNHKHNILHHHYTNIEGVDEDLEAGPFLRLAPGQRRLFFHRFQHVYSWPLFSVLPPKWVFLDDFRNLIEGKIGSQRVPRPRGRDLAVLFGGKLSYLFLALALPLALHPVGAVLLSYALYCLTLGVTIATVFQLAHCVEEAAFEPVPAGGRRIERSFVEHQIATTVDFAPGNRWLGWYLGGLNFQVEHHLFPRVSHVHYPDLAPIVRQVCGEHGLDLLSHRTLGGALRSHVRFLKRMGRRRDGDRAGRHARLC